MNNSTYHKECVQFLVMRQQKKDNLQEEAFSILFSFYAKGSEASFQGGSHSCENLWGTCRKSFESLFRQSPSQLSFLTDCTFSFSFLYIYSANFFPVRFSYFCLSHFLAFFFIYLLLINRSFSIFSPFLFFPLFGSLLLIFLHPLPHSLFISSSVFSLFSLLYQFFSLGSISFSPSLSFFSL